MNQGQNNLNPNNFNIQGNNGIPNNQPLNNQNLSQSMSFNQQPINPQSQPTTNYQQTLMQESISQSINTFESNKANNQNFDNEFSQNVPQNQNIINMYSQQSQQPVQSAMNIYQKPVPQHPNKKLNTKMLIIITISVVVVIAAIVFAPKLFGNKGKQNVVDTLTESTSFWIRNNEDLYAMFDINGKQLTGFDFTSVSSKFVNGTAKVKNKNNEYGIISSKGKMIIEFGKYNSILEHYAVYEMIDKENNKYLYNSLGKLARKLENDEAVKSNTAEYRYVLIESKTKYSIIDYKANSILEFPMVDDDNILNPYVQAEGNYVTVYYNKMNYIIYLPDSKVVLSFQDEDCFAIEDINVNDDSKLLLATSNNWYIQPNTPRFMYVKDGKIIYSKENQEKAGVYFEGDNVILNGDFTYILDESGNKAIKESYKSYKDYKNYIKAADGVLNGMELYVNEQLKEKINCNYVEYGYVKSGISLLSGCSGYGDGRKIYIRFDGIIINNKSYQTASEFDENGYATVSEDGKNFYLINLKGEKVSDYYSNNGSNKKIYNISGTDNLYYNENDDGTMTIFEINGKKLLTGKISWSKTSTVADGKFVVVEKDNKYTVHNLLNGNDIVTLNSKPNMLADYFITSENSKTQYYSYSTGKLFYEK